MDATISLPLGDNAWRLRVSPEKRMAVQRAREPNQVVNPLELLEAALERPSGIDAPLRRAITPDDRVTIVVDESVPEIGPLLGGFLNYLTAAHIDPRNVTLLVAQAGPQAWLDDLPDEYGDVRVEVHHADDRDKLAYLATTKNERRVYLSRTVIDADFVAVIARRRFDGTTGYAGAETAIFPALADEESQKAMAAEYRKDPTREQRSKNRKECFEILDLLGSSFIVEVIEPEGGGIAAISAALGSSAKTGIELLREYWVGTVETPADLVIAVVSGAPGSITFGDLAYALSMGKKVLASEGRLVLLTDAAPVLDEAGELLRKTASPASTLKRIAAANVGEPQAASQWAKSAADTHLFVKSGWPDDLAEEMFATALHTEAEVQRLINAAERVIVLPDAHRMRVKLQSEAE